LERYRIHPRSKVQSTRAAASSDGVQKADENEPAFSIYAIRCK
jgi:hypothetical protein